MIDTLHNSKVFSKDFANLQKEWLKDHKSVFERLPGLSGEIRKIRPGESVRLICKNGVPILQIDAASNKCISDLFYSYLDNRNSFSVEPHKSDGHYSDHETIYALSAEHNDNLTMNPYYSGVEKIHKLIAGYPKLKKGVRNADSLSDKVVLRELLMRNIDTRHHKTPEAKLLLYYEKIMSAKVVYENTAGLTMNESIIVSSTNRIVKDFLKILFEEAFNAGALEMRLDNDHIYLYNAFDLPVDTVEGLLNESRDRKEILKTASRLIPKTIKVMKVQVASVPERLVFLKFLKNGETVESVFALDELAEL